MTAVDILAQFNREMARREGRESMSRTEGIRIIPHEEWSEANVFLVHRTLRGSIFQPRVDQVYAMFPLADNACYLHHVDESIPSTFARDAVTCVRATQLPAPDGRLEIVTRHKKRGSTWEKKIVI